LTKEVRATSRATSGGSTQLNLIQVFAPWAYLPLFSVLAFQTEGGGFDIW